jgi:hypothetical protein
MSNAQISFVAVACAALAAIHHRKRQVHGSVDERDYLETLGHPWWLSPAHSMVTDGTVPERMNGEIVCDEYVTANDEASLVFGSATRKTCFMVEDGLAFLNHGSYGATLRCA